MSQTQDDDSFTMSADLDDKRVTIKGRNLEFRDIALIVAGVVIVVLAAIIFLA